MCLGGHLAYRCALDKRVHTAVCYFATDIHSGSLGSGGPGGKDDSLSRAKDIEGELIMVRMPESMSVCSADRVNLQIFGKKDNHVPPPGRDLIRKTLTDAGVTYSFYEVAHAQHAFIRDELSKGRYDPAISKVCFEMLLELFGRALKTDLGPPSREEQKIEDVC